MNEDHLPRVSGRLPQSSARRPEIQTQLTRDLGLVSALAIGVGTMIAAGIFTLSGLAVGNVGSAAIAAFLLAAVAALFTALTYCEFTSIYPESGEGYLYARKTFAPPFAFMVGWCLLLGYTSSCAFYVASLSSYFNEFLVPALHHTRLEMLAGLVALAGLTLLNVKGTKESGTFQIVITAGKVVLLVWFIAGGVLHAGIDTDVLIERFSTDLLKIGSTAALVFITFFGFSAIAASAGEVTEPTKTIPRAIFISMGLVTLLYSAVVLVMVMAQLSEYSEAAMGTAAKTFLGSVGGMVIVGGALFSMVSASNASIMAGSRVALSMAHLAHLPPDIGRVDARTRTPVVALLLTGSTIGGFALMLELERLANFANCVLLIALIAVNVALILHRRLYPDIERPFRVPFVPVLPALGILANAYLLTQIEEWAPILLAVAAIGMGFLSFLAWKGTTPEEAELPGSPSRVALERAAMTQGRFRVVVPLANPATAERLIDLAAAIAGPRQGEIIALRVVSVPDQTAPAREDLLVDREIEVLDVARARALEHGIPVTSLVRVGHDVARAILETSRERHAHLIVLGWEGRTTTARKILGEVTDAVVNHARTDLLLVKFVGEEPPRRLLLPSAGGEHAIRAEEYAADIAKSLDGSITLCGVVPEGAEHGERVTNEEARLAGARLRMLETTPLEDDESVRVQVLRHGSVSAAIIDESDRHDAVVVGAAGQSFSTRVLFGSIPEEIARRAPRTVIVVKKHHAVKALVGRVMTE